MQPIKQTNTIVSLPSLIYVFLNVAGIKLIEYIYYNADLAFLYLSVFALNNNNKELCVEIKQTNTTSRVVGLCTCQLVNPAAEVFCLDNDIRAY